MSIAIDDMKMPKSCIACPFEHNGDCYGGKPKRIMDIEDFKSSRHPDCPLIEAEPVKHGHWIEKIIYSHSYAECSECKTVYSWSETETMRFCKRCGARMDGEEDGLL